jgi:hypothetical protein
MYTTNQVYKNYSDVTKEVIRTVVMMAFKIS